MEEREEMLGKLNKNIGLIPTELLDVLVKVSKKLVQPGRETSYRELQSFLEEDDLELASPGWEED